MNSQSKDPLINRIAVIGIGCIYPGANSPLELWENILARKQQFREMPDVRLPNNEYYDSNPETPDKTYQNKAAVLDGYTFDWLGKRIPKKTYESTDIVHWLALDTALQALSDAGISKEYIEKENTGVVLGNTLTGEFTRSNQMMLRWPYVRKTLKASLEQKGLLSDFDEISSIMEHYYKSVFTPVNEDTLAGGLANTIAGRVCNFLDLHGGGYIVDGACSSSLLAITSAANYLESGQMDMVIAGGVDISLDTFELIGFAKTRALTRDEMRVYDKDGKGFLPGEGCGIVVLKRLEDALRDNNKIYATINGWGISSDGKGGITAPSATGQARALKRAHRKARIDTEKINFIEGHGTGTTVGDRIELEGISLAMNADKNLPLRNCGVTSFKSIVGHTKAAAGVGAFIKTVIALNQRVLPPTAGLKEFNPIFEEKAKTVYPILFGEVKSPQETLYAGVSAMGFGGINSHVVLQSGGGKERSLKPELDEQILMVSNQYSEVFCIAAPDIVQLRIQLKNTLADAHKMSYGEMADLAAKLNQHINMQDKFRLAVVAKTPHELEKKLNTCINKLELLENKGAVSLENNTIVLGQRNENLLVGSVFPGQGSQKLNMGYKLKQRFTWVKDIIEEAQKIFSEEGEPEVLKAIYRPLDKAVNQPEIIQWRDDLKQTNLAQPAITLSSYIWYKFFERLGVRFSYSAGHSLGELMAFYAAGYYDEETLFRFASKRGRIMAECGSGTMASLVCTPDTAKELFNGVPGYVTIANINAPEQTVISGDEESINYVVEKAEANHIAAVKLPVAAAFHSKLISDTATAIKSYDQLKNNTRRSTSVKVISTVSSEILEGAIDLNEYFSEQCTEQVNFIDATETLKDVCDVLIELGPGKVLSGLVRSITTDLDCFPVEATANDDISLNTCIANLFVKGVDINFEELYKNRLIRKFTPAHEKTFLTNPLERPLTDNGNKPLAVSDGSISGWIDHLDLSDEKHQDYIRARAGFIKDIIAADMKHFSTSTSISKSIEVLPKSEKPEPNTHPETADIKNLLYQKLEEATGFPQENYQGNMKLLDDFNLDSIKAGSLIGDLIQVSKVKGKVEAAQLANASLAEIIENLSEPNSSLPDKKNSQNIDAKIISMLAEITGFPGDAIGLEFKLLDDLNLDSIKVGSFIADCAKHFNLTGRLEPAKFANASVRDIVDAISEFVDEGNLDSKAGNENSDPGWVQSFTGQWQEKVRDDIPEEIEQYWKNRTACVLTSDFCREQAKQLEQILSGEAGIEVVSLRAEEENPSALTDKHPLLIIPVKEVGPDIAEIEKAAHLLVNAARLSANSNADLLFIEAIHSSEYTSTASAFASSIHLERPAARIRYIQYPAEIPDADFTRIIKKEMSGKPGFRNVRYNTTGKRMEFVHSLAYDRSAKRNLKINEGDVVLVTGGAKGITAELGLAFAKRYKCRMALLGSSPLSSGNTEITDTLQRYREASLTAKYYSGDISDPQAIERVLASVVSELGNIRGVIHGAGRNIPRRAEQVSHTDALKEISPKVWGAYNLIHSTHTEKVSFFIALTSIIGVTGMQGNAWYAFANQTTDNLIQQLNKDRGADTLTLAYSVWSEVGMGARMGSVDILSKIGIGAISPDKGVREFMHWTEHKADNQQIVIAARLGGLDTWLREQPLKPAASRYLEELRYFEPGVELVARCKLNREVDQYTDDHNYNGSLLFPTVFGIEAMAQAVCRLTGTVHPEQIVLENISLRKPIVVPASGAIEIEIHAKLITDDPWKTSERKFYVGIATEQSSYSDDHFSAEISLPAKLSLRKDEDQPPKKALPIHPESDLYSWLLFQGPRFRQIDKVYEINSQSAEFSTKSLTSDSSEICFSAQKLTPFILGSPLVRDTLLQSFQLIITQYKALPVHINKWVIAGPGRSSEGGRVKCTFREHENKTFYGDVIYTSPAGDTLEIIEGYELAELEANPDFPLPEYLAETAEYLEKEIENTIEKWLSKIRNKPELYLSKHAVSFTDLKKKERHQFAKELLAARLKHTNTFNIKADDLQWNENGRPCLNIENVSISFSHKATWLIMCLGKQNQGCDFEIVEQRPRNKWEQMLGNRHSNLLNKLSALDRNESIAGTRLWTVMEAAIKASGLIPQKIEIADQIEDSYLFAVTTGKSKMHVLCLLHQLYPGQAAVLSLIVEAEIGKKKNEPSQQYSKSGALTDQEGKFTTQYLTTFKDCRGFGGKTYFTNFPIWMGKFREEVLSPIKTELLRDLGSGKFGMVTNESGMKIYSETDALNTVVGKLSVTDRSDFEKSFIDFRYEWYVAVQDNLIPLAETQLSTTWVSILERGIVKQSPIPDYFMKYLLQNPVFHFSGDRKDDEFPFKHLDLGNEPFYFSEARPRPDILLLSKKYDTGLHNGNTVGNLYYSNYYDWQARNIEHYLHTVNPLLYTGKAGEYICIDSSVSHLQEAMPFEDILVNMYLESLYDEGIRFYFEYYAGEASARRKLATGYNTIVWVARNGKNSKPLKSSMPKQIADEFALTLNIKTGDK